MRRPRAALLLLLAGLSAWCVPSPLPGQPALNVGTHPTPGYFLAAESFSGGRYPRALKAFLAEERASPLVTAQAQHWIDAICYETMAGECCYEMGELGAALAHYTAALKLFLAFPDWLNQTNFPPPGPPRVQTEAAPWGASARLSPHAHFPDPLWVVVPKPSVDLGPSTPAALRSTVGRLEMHAVEIVRCTTLAMRRRAMLLGPAAAQDLVLSQTLGALSRRPAPPGAWPQAWLDLELGTAQAAVGRDREALETLTRAVLVGGQLDHPLTAHALLQLGILQAARGDHVTAAGHFNRATAAAAQWRDAGAAEEAFRWGTALHILINRKDSYPPLVAALAWSNRPQLRHLHAALALLAAENLAHLHRSREAATMLDEARTAMGPEMAAGRVGARLNYVAAMVLFQQDRSPQAEAALAAAMAFMRRGSVWLGQMAVVDERCAGGSQSTTAREALDLYSRVLRDPQAMDWAGDPLESLAALAMPHAAALEHWLEVAVERRDARRALEIADRLRRRRFYASLPDGGRSLAMRWLLESPPDSLTAKALAARGDVLRHHPEYEPLAEQARRLATTLRELPWSEEAEGRGRSRYPAQLAALGARQEAVLREIALSRETAEMVYPPLRRAEEIQAAIPERSALVAFICTRRATYGFLVDRGRCNLWQVESPQRVGKTLVSLMQRIAGPERSRKLTLKDLADRQWEATAAELAKMLLEGSRWDLSGPLEELIVVPDGALWHLPFEVLPVKSGRGSQPLLARTRVRYLPLAALAVPEGRRPRPAARTGVAVGRLWPQQGEALGRKEAGRIARVLPGTTVLPAPFPAGGPACATRLDRLIVLDQLPFPEGDPLGWSVLGRQRAGGTLREWMALPWPRPETVVLPGLYVTAGRPGRAPPGGGQDVFLALCALMAGGTQTALVGRWPGGGQSAYDLVREFVQEIPHCGAAEAWQRSALLLAESRLDVEAEPRLAAGAGDAPKAAHPFFWAGYVLVDSASPREDDAQGAAPPGKQDR